MIERIEYILAHGSRNTFVMIDAVAQPIETQQAAEFVREVCRHFDSDGVLFLERNDEGFYGMNMYNTDGTRAEMCGNGMRLVARLAHERYLHCDKFTLMSGGRPYPIYSAESTMATMEDGTQQAIPNYGVSINIRTASDDFLLHDNEFVASKIDELDEQLTFTYLNLGNPHIVAQVDEIDLDHLSRLGERVKSLPHIFPHGVNVSFMQHIGEQQIFVATYERGVGLTASCGTAMTASSTTAALIGVCRWDEAIEVRNRGGFVRCICSRECGELTTQLVGNATYIERGEITTTQPITAQCDQQFTSEVEAWDRVTNVK